MQLRPYQKEAVEAVYGHLREKDTNPCVVIPTAGGKSCILGQIAADAVKRWRGRVLVLAHVKELLQQNADKIRRFAEGVPVGLYSAGLDSRDTAEPVIVAGIQSVYNKAAALGRFDLVLIDEVHTVPAEGEGMYRTFLEAEKRINPLVRLIGFTATPYRLQGGSICKPENLLQEVCYEARIPELIAQGYLSPITAKAGRSGAKLAELHIRAGEFVSDEVEAAMNESAVVDRAVRDMLDLARDRKHVMIFCSGVKHCKHVAKVVRSIAGEECAVVTGDTPAHERAETLARFKGEKVADLLGEDRPLRFLANVGVLTTGFDAPCIDCVVLLRPTMSPGLYQQMVGRGFRLSPGTGKQNCLVLDYGGNIERHGPVDMIRIREKAQGQTHLPPAAKECPQCRELIHPAVRLCPSCGYVFPAPERQGIEARAANGGILSGEFSEEEHPVTRVSYGVHTKRGAPEGAPRTVEVTYTVDMLTRFKEWLCPEHTGFARKKFESWWRRHAPGCDFPKDAQDAVWLASEGAVKEPESITVRTVAGEKYPRVVDYKFTTPVAGDSLDDDELPF